MESAAQTGRPEGSRAHRAHQTHRASDRSASQKWALAVQARARGETCPEQVDAFFFLLLPFSSLDNFRPRGWHDIPPEDGMRFQCADFSKHVI